MCVLALAACGELPRPLAPESKPLSAPLLLPADRAGILVTPAIGVRPESGEAIATALAAALRGVDIPADTRSRNARSLLLVSAVAPTTNGDRLLTADLYAPDGMRMSRHEMALPRGGEPPASTAAWSASAEAIAAAIVATLATPVGRVAPPPMALAIGTIAGPKPQDADILARALAYSLQRARVKLADGANSEALRVSGEVQFAANGARERRLHVRWEVRQPDGNVLGDVKQENDVPVDLLERAWPEIALAIAEAAADGIADLLQQTTRLRP